MPNRTAPPDTKGWVARNADRLDYPDAGDPFRPDIKVDVPAETKVRLEATALGILPGCRFYTFAGFLYRVDRDGLFAQYGIGGWQPIEGATLKTDAAEEITADAAYAAVVAYRKRGDH